MDMLEAVVDACVVLVLTSGGEAQILKNQYAKGDDQGFNDPAISDLLGKMNASRQGPAPEAPQEEDPAVTAFENQLKQLALSSGFRLMMAECRNWFEDEHEALVAYHALMRGAPPILDQSPLVVGSVVQRIVQDPSEAFNLVTSVRKEWL